MGPGRIREDNDEDEGLRRALGRSRTLCEAALPWIPLHTLLIITKIADTHVHILPSELVIHTLLKLGA